MKERHTKAQANLAKLDSKKARVDFESERIISLKKHKKKLGEG